MKIAEPAHQVGPSFEGEDTVLVRVVERVSNVTMRTPREAVGRIKELARNVPTLTPEAYVRAYAHIGRTYCYPSNPECGPCPLLHSCRLGLQRLARAEVREGKWGRSAK